VENDLLAAEVSKRIMLYIENFKFRDDSERFIFVGVVMLAFHKKLKIPPALPLSKEGDLISLLLKGMTKSTGRQAAKMMRFTGGPQRVGPGAFGVKPAYPAIS